MFPSVPISPSIREDGPEGGAPGGGVIEGLMSWVPLSSLIPFSGAEGAPDECFF